MQAGQLMPSELLESCLSRIESLDETVCAWALVDKEGAREAAQRADRAVRDGQPLGPFQGIPVGIKDVYHTKGLRTEAGSKVLAGFVPAYDATAVEHLKQAGAIILGKVHTTEFATFDPSLTHNPWNPAHTPGGSSSGSAAAVAARMCPAALGNQTAGSIIRPAAFNGVVGFKPQHGRVSGYGVIPISPTEDHPGVLARSVADAALFFQVLAGRDPRDPLCSTRPVPNCLAVLESRRSAPKLGLVKESYIASAEPETLRHLDVVLDQLREAGATILDLDVPESFAAIVDTHHTIMWVDCAASHESTFLEKRDLYGPRIREIIEEGLVTPATKYARARQAQVQQRADMEPVMRSVDAVIAPAATGPAPRGLGYTGNPVMQVPWTHLGFPAISLPTGLSQGGLPLGIQLVGAPFGDAELLAVARWCEKALDVHLEHP